MADPSTSVAFGDALAAVLTVCVPAVAAILSGALWKLWAKWGFQATAADKANMDSELQAALAFGVAKALPVIKAKGWDHVDTHAAILASAAQYFLQRFPDRTATIVTAATVGAATPPPSLAVSDTLSARLPEAIAVAAASPATPPVPTAALAVPTPASGIRP